MAIRKSTVGKKPSRAKAKKPNGVKPAKLKPRPLPELAQTADTLTRARHMLLAAVKCFDQGEEEVDIGWATYEVIDMLERVQKDVDAANDHQYIERHNAGGAT